MLFDGLLAKLYNCKLLVCWYITTRVLKVQQQIKQDLFSSQHQLLRLCASSKIIFKRHKNHAQGAKKAGDKLIVNSTGDDLATADPTRSEEGQGFWTRKKEIDVPTKLAITAKSPAYTSFERIGISDSDDENLRAAKLRRVTANQQLLLPEHSCHSGAKSAQPALSAALSLQTPAGAVRGIGILYLCRDVSHFISGH